MVKNSWYKYEVNFFDGALFLCMRGLCYVFFMDME